MIRLAAAVLLLKLRALFHANFCDIQAFAARNTHQSESPVASILRRESPGVRTIAIPLLSLFVLVVRRSVDVDAFVASRGHKTVDVAESSAGSCGRDTGKSPFPQNTLARTAASRFIMRAM